MSRAANPAALQRAPILFKKLASPSLSFYKRQQPKKVVMGSYEIEIILNRQLADCLSIPVFITDTAGDLIFYNEPAEQILGKRFEERLRSPRAPTLSKILIKSS